MPGIRLPPIMVRIILRAPSKSLSNPLTSLVVEPEPLAIRRRRDPWMIAGFRRSSGVMDRMMASARRSSPSSTWFASSFIASLPPGHAREHLEQVLDRTELPHLPELREEVVQRELALQQLFRRGPSRVGVHGLLRLVDQGQHVAHAQDAPGHAVGVERLEVVGLLARPDEVHRQARHRRDRERRAASRVAVELRQDEPGRVDLVHERPRLDHGVLTGHGVARHQHVMRLRHVADAPRLLHHVGVDVQPPGGVDDDDVGLLALGLLHARLRHLHRVAPLGEHGDADLAAEGAQLLHGRGPLEVGRDQQRPAALPLQVQRELRAGGRLPGALDARHHDDHRTRPGELERLMLAAERDRELLVRRPSRPADPG